MSSFPDVVVIGAGPYGLSIAAHLRALNVDFRIFGETMAFWRKQMPEGMLLKSDGYASNLSGPQGGYTLKAFSGERGLPYADEGLPVALDKFVAYGQAFQKRMVPEVEERLVVAVDRAQNGFVVRLDNGELVAARVVIVAVGIGHFPYLPPIFDGISPDAVSHSSVHHDLSGFKGKEVCVVGGGASAIDTAALLHEAGAAVQLVTRRVTFHDRLALKGRSLTERLRVPHSGVGGGWRSVFFAQAPLLFRTLPEEMRLRAVRNANGPAGGWAMKDRVIGKFPILEGYAPSRAWTEGATVRMRVARDDGQPQDLKVDHVIAGTGYHNDLRRLSFLGREIGARIKSVEHTPILSANFESSVPGLYFVGPLTKNTFGPLMRFVFGAHFAACRVSRHVAASAVRSTVAAAATAGAD